MKNDFVMPILVLSLICLVISGALAFTNSVTEPVIAKAAIEREETARYEIIPEADGFELIVAEGLPDTIREVYKSTNNVGYIFMLLTSGYGGDMKIICGIDSDGMLVGSKVIEYAETKGLGSKITESPFIDQFDEMYGSGIHEVDAITGATISSSAYIGAIQDAFDAFVIVNAEG